MKKIIIIMMAAVAVIGACFYIQQKDKATMQDLKISDAEFSSVFNRFVNNEVKPQGSLDVQTRLKVLLASNIASQAPGQFRITMDEALAEGLTPIEIKEIVYQAVPYVGYAKVYDFINLANGIMQQKGIKLPLENQSTTTAQNRLEKGINLQKEIFGAENIETMRAQAPQELKHIQDYLSANCFGDYYTRQGLDLKTRELLTFAMLVSLGGADAQVKAHAQGNLNVGNNKQVLIDTVTQLLPYIGYPRSLNAIAAVNAVAPQN